MVNHQKTYWALISQTCRHLGRSACGNLEETGWREQAFHYLSTTQSTSAIVETMCRRSKQIFEEDSDFFHKIGSDVIAKGRCEAGSRPTELLGYAKIHARLSSGYKVPREQQSWPPKIWILCWDRRPMHMWQYLRKPQRLERKWRKRILRFHFGCWNIVTETCPNAGCPKKCCQKTHLRWIHWVTTV